MVTLSNDGESISFSLLKDSMSLCNQKSISWTVLETLFHMEVAQELVKMGNIICKSGTFKLVLRLLQIAPLPRNLHQLTFRELTNSCAFDATFESRCLDPLRREILSGTVAFLRRTYSSFRRTPLKFKKPRIISSPPPSFVRHSQNFVVAFPPFSLRSLHIP